MKFTPYWLDTSPRDRTGPPPRWAASVDVAVVGAGLTGLSAALHLARKGAKVAVLERDTVAFGASGRNGGMATTGLSIGFRDAIARYGFPTASALFLAYNDAIDSVEKLVGEEGIDCDFARTGKMTLAAKPGHYDGLRKTHDVLAERLGYETQMVPEERDALGDRQRPLPRRDGRPQGRGPARRQVHPRARGGRGQAGRADPREGAGRAGPAAGWHQARGGDLAGHASTADQVLVATSGYTSRPFRWQQLRIAPGGQLHHRHRAAGQGGLRPADAEPPDGLGHQEPPLLLPDHPRPPAAVRRPGPVRDVQPGSRTRRAAGSCRRRWSRCSRSSRRPRVDYCWGGLVDMSMDRMVHAGEHDGLYYSLGYSGHGVQMATYMGKQMAEYMNGAPDANPWRDLTFKRIPGHFGPPWFLPFAGAYYKSLDVIK